MKLLAIDPGTTGSGWVLFAHGKVLDSGVMSNVDLRRRINERSFGLTWADAVAIEMVASFGMAVGAETFRTVWWAGRFADCWFDQTGNLPIEIFRKEVKLHLCGNAKAKDKNIRQALIDLYGGEGGKDAAIGKKANPGPLYGVSSHAWSALAVAVTASAMLQPKQAAA